ncbi:hypothetical protein G9A89_018169 [Geosiphon pyriformis]|nr:hypothetical protein G9A89_015479 [Geosiphon pyriformis]KAG9306286.1 hypothetical protein G9A89_018169 [Geosiphon pyriformis]
MYTIKDYVERPLDVVKKLFEANWSPIIPASGSHFGIPTNFKQVFDTEEAIQQIPSLNDIAARDIPSNTLVRFRAMIQNSGLGHEIYVSVFESLCTNGNQQWNLHKYSDDIDQASLLSPVYDSAESVFDERHLYYCVSVPVFLILLYGYTDINLSRPKKNILNVRDLELLTSNLSIDEEYHDEHIMSKFPFPNETHVSAIVKVYEKDESLKVCDVVEFIGVIDHPSQYQEVLDNGDFIEPISLLPAPRIHAIFYRKLHHSNNPLISFSNLDATIHQVKQAAKLTRIALIKYIASAFKEDLLVAEFVLLQLLSRTYNRREDITLGKFGLNITNIPPAKFSNNDSLSSRPISLTHSNPFARNIGTLLSSLLPKYHDLPLNLSTLNNIFFYPQCEDVLQSGVFQVSEGTCFSIDETVLNEGKLGDQGVRNAQVLAQVLRNQKLNYVFPFSNFEFNIDIGLIILSNAKSLFPADCAIPLDHSMGINTTPSPSPDTMNNFRKYLSIMRHSEYLIPENIAEFIQRQFVSQRQEASREGTPLMTPEDLFFRMNLARLVTLSFGEVELTTELWNYTQKLDRARQQRIEQIGLAPTE